MIVIHLLRNTLDFVFEVVHGGGKLCGELFLELVARSLGLPESAIHCDARQNHHAKHNIYPHDFCADVLLQQLRVVNNDELQAVYAASHIIKS